MPRVGDLHLLQLTIRWKIETKGKFHPELQIANVLSMKRLQIIAFLLLLSIVQLLPGAAAAESLPNDPLLKSQWGWFDVYADRAYNTSYHGQGVIVAVLDTGVDINHPDLSANLLAGHNFVAGEDPNNYTDVDGHGTMVAGIIAAVANNSVGIAGVAPAVKILPLKVLTSAGGSFFNVDQAILYAYNHGAKVINMSFGSNSSLDPLTQNEIQFAYTHDVVLVAAAGNYNSSSPFYPAAYNNSVIAVSALSPLNKKSSYSNYGYIELAAPGDKIASTSNKGGYVEGSGTSFAAPIVSAVSALMLSKNSSMTPAQVRMTLDREAINLGSAGYSQYYGYGLVNACAAVALNSSSCPSVPGWTGGNNIPPLSLNVWILVLSAIFALLIVRRNFRNHDLNATRKAFDQRSPGYDSTLIA